MKTVFYQKDGGDFMFTKLMRWCIKKINTKNGNEGGHCTTKTVA